MYQSLYIHIPFCMSKCMYCDFLSVTYSESLATVYVDALCKELVLKSDGADRLETVYIGGGTPSMLSEECFIKLFQFMKRHFSFSSRPEITVEINPGTLDRSKSDMLRALGINRISIGAQSFDDGELASLGRSHRSSDTLTAINLLRASGFENISIDLIYGIPMQTLRGWKKTIAKTTELSLSHVSAYELTPAMNTKLYDHIKANLIALPDEQNILDMYHYTIERLTASRFQHYEISNFAMPDFRCAHNLNYWDRGQYAGIGAGAHSFLSGTRFKNTDNIRSYITCITSGTIPQSESAELNKSEHLKEHIFLGLRKREGLNIRGINLSDYPVVEACSEFFDSGFMEMDMDSIRLTGKGLPVANTIIVRIIEKLDLG